MAKRTQTGGLSKDADGREWVRSSACPGERRLSSRRGNPRVRGPRDPSAGIPQEETAGKAEKSKRARIGGGGKVRYFRAWFVKGWINEEMQRGQLPHRTSCFSVQLEVCQASPWKGYLKRNLSITHPMGSVHPGEWIAFSLQNNCRQPKSWVIPSERVDSTGNRTAVTSFPTVAAGRKSPSVMLGDMLGSEQAYSGSEVGFSQNYGQTVPAHRGNINGE